MTPVDVSTLDSVVHRPDLDMHVKIAHLAVSVIRPG